MEIKRLLLITIVVSFLVDVNITHPLGDIINERFIINESGKIKDKALSKI